MDKNGFLINHLVEFWPDKQKLLSRIDGKTIILHYPASCILLALINNKNTIVSQAELIHIAWGTDFVTQNRLYQSILNLRKGLLDVGLAKSTIKTIPRNGLMLPSEITIEPIAQALPPLVEPVHQELASPSHSDSDSIEQKQPERSKQIPFIFNHRTIAWFVLFASLSILSIAINCVISARASYFKEFSKIIENKECTYYAISNDKKQYQKYIEDYKIPCPKNNIVYLIHYNNIQKLSVMTCNVNEAENCTSILYMGAK